jgi:acetylornithine deacetylase/succinyl-diaminopimelate desuccinylase-like protein
MSTFDSFVSSQRDRMLEELKALLRIPSVSTDPGHSADCRRAAEWIGDHLRKLGCPKVEYLASDTHPIVWAEGPAAPGKPTVIVYGHYDVQPPDPLAEWTSPPFEPTVRGGDIFARGATDDKGQVFAVIKAFEALLAQGAPPVNVRFLIEGQEEAGSKILFDLLAKRPELVQGDAVLVSDTPYYAKGVPSVETGLRGLCYVEISVRTSKTDLHSGLYGGAAPNAHETLVRILAALKGADGRIKIPGLYELVERPSRKVREGWAKLPFNERKFLKEEVGSKALTGLKQYTVLERLWALPTLEIHGIMGGFTGEGSKTVIPAVATAKVSLRLVPKLTEKKVLALLTKAVKAAAPAYAEVSIKSLHGADPVVVDVESKPIAVMDRAFRDVIKKGVVLTRSGGSIPIVPELGKAGAPVVLSGIGLPDDRLHAPNEKINLDQVWTGIKVFGRFFQLMGDG